MEESGIETTPPVSPVPPVTVDTAVSSPPIITGKSFTTSCSFVWSELPISIFSKPPFRQPFVLFNFKVLCKYEFFNWLFMAKGHFCDTVLHFSETFFKLSLMMYFKSYIPEYTTPVCGGNCEIVYNAICDHLLILYHSQLQ